VWEETSLKERQVNTVGSSAVVRAQVSLSTAGPQPSPLDEGPD
jgi:hypothetical protein